MKSISMVFVLVLLSINGLSLAGIDPNEFFKVWKDSYGKFDSLPLEISCKQVLTEISSTVDPIYAEKKPYSVEIHKIQMVAV